MEWTSLTLQRHKIHTCRVIHTPTLWRLDFQIIFVLYLSRVTHSSARAMQHENEMENLAKFPHRMLAGCPVMSANVSSPWNLPVVFLAFHRLSTPQENDILVDTNWIKICGQNLSLPPGVRAGGGWQHLEVVSQLCHRTLAPPMVSIPKYLCFVTILTVSLH